MKKHYGLLIIVVLVLIAIWPFTTFSFIPKWDNINCYLPYKYFSSDNIWNGHGPWWNPYMKLGYPGYSDMQNGLWNPIMWLLLLFGKYTTVTQIVEIIIYFILCVFGIYKFSGLYIKNIQVKYMVTLSYVLSGFMIDTNQIMVFIMGYVWLPWILFYLIQFNRSKDYKNVIFSAFFIALHVTSASPAFTIVLAYIIIGNFIYLLIKEGLKKQIDLKLVSGYLITVLLVVILVLPFIVSFIDFAPYFSRLEKLPYDEIIFDASFDFMEYISFLLPYSVLAETDIFYPTPPTLRNAYFGIFFFVILVYAFIKHRNRTINTFIILGIFALILAAANYTPVYRFFYHLPGFGLFKQSSIFRAHAIFCFVLATGIGLEKIIAEKTYQTKLYISLFVAALIFFIASTLFALGKTSYIAIKENIIDWMKLNEFPRGGIYTFIVINGVITIGLLSVYLLSLIQKRKTHQKILLVLVAMDLFIMFQLSIPTTLIYNFPLKSHTQGFANLPNEINQRPTKIPLKNVEDGVFYMDGMWLNKSTFSKTVHFEGVNPTRSKFYVEMVESGAVDLIKQNPLFFVPHHKINHPEDVDSIQNAGWDLPEGIIAQKETQIIDAQIGYNSFSVTVSNPSDKKSLIALSQNYHHLWKAYSDEKELKIYKINTGIMGVEIPGGFYGEIKLKYSPNKYLTSSFFLSLLTYLSILSFILLRRKKVL